MAARCKLSQAAIERVIRAAVRGGVDIGAVEVTSDGVVRIIPARQAGELPADAFEAWEQTRRGHRAA